MSMLLNLVLIGLFLVTLAVGAYVLFVKKDGYKSYLPIQKPSPQPDPPVVPEPPSNDPPIQPIQPPTPQPPTPQPPLMPLQPPPKDVHAPVDTPSTTSQYNLAHLPAGCTPHGMTKYQCPYPPPSNERVTDKVPTDQYDDARDKIWHSVYDSTLVPGQTVDDVYEAWASTHGY